MVNIRKELMYCVEGVAEGVFIFERENALRVDMVKVLRSRIIVGETEI